MRNLALLFLLLSVRLPAQQTSGVASIVSVNNGLSQGMVFDIMQSRDGFIWIATKDGLNRYDGYHCKIFWPDPFDSFSVAASEIYRIFEDSRGRIWIATPVGLDIFLPASGRFFHLPKERLPGLKAGRNYYSGINFAEAPDGAIWIENADLLYRIEEPTALLEAATQAGNAYPEFRLTDIPLPTPAGPSNDPVLLNSVWSSKNHSLLVGTTAGLYALDTAGRQLVYKALAGTPVRICGEERSGQIWLQVPDLSKGFTDPLTRYIDYPDRLWNSCTWDGRSIRSLNLTAKKVELFRFDREGYLWTLFGNTLRKWAPDALAEGGKPEFEWTCTEPFTRVAAFYYPSLTIDRSGIAWLGTNGYGMLKVNTVKPTFTSYLPLSTQRYLMEGPQGWLWTFAEPKILYTSKNFDRSVPNPWTVVTNGRGVSATVFDAAGNGWGIVDKENLFRFDAQSKAVRSFPWTGRGLVYSTKGKLLSAAEEGLLQFDPVTEQRTLFAFEQPKNFFSADHYIYYLFEDHTGSIWIFAFEGLIRASPFEDGYHFDYFKNNPADTASLFNNFVLSLADDPLEPDRYLWVGTKVGLNRLDKRAGTFKHFGTAQGLPDNVVYGILSDNSGHIWLSTNKGLCRFHVRDETVKNFTQADGLQSDEFNQGSYLKRKDGALIFGGVNGLTMFYPDSLRFNEYVPQTQIVGIKVNNEPFDVNRLSIQTLAHDQNFLTIEFAALEFSNSAQNHYRYRLIRYGIFGGKEGDYEVDLGERNLVQFANLQPGRYTFQVLGSNNDGIWSREPAVLQFVIQPPWWASWWAYLLYISLVVASGWMFYRYQLRRRIEHQETLRLRELDDFKNRFFTNITHEFRTPLTVILGTAQQLSGQPTGAPAHDKINLIKRNGENLLRLINQLLDLAKLESKSLKINYEQGDVLPYLRYIAESLHSFANAQNVLLRVESSEAAIVMDYDAERLLQIVYNLLSNAVKFTASGGRVVLRAAVVTRAGVGASPTPTGALQMTVADNGAGIPAEDLPHIFDRFYQANNLEKAKAGGTGIGLALTRELVGMMGGEISVDSTVGVGSKFTVLLPINRLAKIQAKKLTVADQKNGFENTLPATPRLPADGGEATHILIIEDNPDVVEYLIACLEQGDRDGGDRQGRPYGLDFAYNGRAGIEKALESIPDLIISDVMMPEKDGFEVCDTLKNDERTSHIPLILLTAKADVESRLAGLRRGADAYLTKPFHQEELLLTLHNLLEQRKKWQTTFRNRSIEPATVPNKQAADAPFPPTDLEDAFLQNIIVEIEKYLDDADFGVPQLSRKMGLSQSQLYRKIKALTDLSTAAFIRHVRLLEGKKLLETTELTMAEVAYRVGFTTPNYFSDAFFETFGNRPNAMRN